MIKGNSSNSTDQKPLKIHLRFYTALILNDLVNEIPFSNVLTKYDCQKGALKCLIRFNSLFFELKLSLKYSTKIVFFLKGFLQSLQQSSSTYASMITVFCNRLGWFNLELLVNQFQSRLMFGVQRQLLDLVRIKLLNSHRARLFYNSGFTTVASVAMCDLKKIEKILRTSISYGYGKRSENENVDNKNQANHMNNSEAVIWSETKGYTYWEASVVILKEANDMLKSDLELLGVKMKTEKNSNGNKLNKTSNKTLFDFNETFDSMIQTQKSIQKNNSIK